MKTYILTPKFFAELFRVKENDLSLLVKKTIQKANFKYRTVGGEEYKKVILMTIKALDSGSLKTSGTHRLSDWEKGWKENLLKFNRNKYDLHELIPKFVKGTYLRLKGKFINPESNSFETDFISVMRYHLFGKYYSRINTLYEFGVGTGLNLVAASKIYPKMKLVGLDWTKSSIEIINALKKNLKINISGRRFDLFKPDTNYQLDRGSAILTIGTLEQLGENFRPFVNYLLLNSPKVCIHIETIYELYDDTNLLDYLAIKYIEQRNYLRGFLPYLKILENRNKIKILEVKRTFGSFYHEGYTYIVWKPI